MANTIRIKRGTKAQIEASELGHGEPAISTDYDQVYVGTAESQVRLASASEIPAFATPAIALGSSASAGDATTVIRSNATIAAFDATAPSSQAFGDSPSAGSAAVAARRDHKHGMPADPVSDAAYGPTWDGVTGIAPSKNAVYDAMEGRLTVTRQSLQLYVDDASGNDTTGDGSSGAPWKTISKAIAWLVANAAQITYDVYVNIGGANATYNESLNLNGLTVPARLYLRARTPAGKNLYDYGVATGGSTTTLQDTTKNWETDQFVGCKLCVLTGTGADQVLTITANNANTLTFATATAPAAGSQYMIYGPTVNASTTGPALTARGVNNVSVYGLKLLSRFSGSPPAVLNVQSCLGWEVYASYIQSDTESGPAVAAWVREGGWLLLHRCRIEGRPNATESIGAGVRSNAFLEFDLCLFYRGVSGKGIGLWVYQMSMGTASGLASRFVGWEVGIKTTWMSFCRSSSIQTYASCGTNYTPTTPGSPDPSSND